MEKIYDVAIVGSGYGGMLPAYKLARAGYKVILIERGRIWKKEEYRHSLTLEYLNQIYDIATSSTLGELYRGSKIFGGGSTTNDKIHQRTPSESFEYEEEEFHGRRAWPENIDRTVMDPFYEELESLLSIRQISWNEVSMIGGNFARMFKDAGMSAEPCNFNIGPNCIHCGYCEAGCGREGTAKITLTSALLRPALRTGNLEIITEMSAKTIKPLRGGEYRVELVNSSKENLNSGADKLIFANKVIVGAGPIGSVPLLLRSKRYLKNISSALGKYVSNNGDINFVLKTPDHYPDHYGFKSATSCGVITYGYWDKYKKTIHPGMIPIQVAAGVNIKRKGQLPWGLNHKHFLRDNVTHRLIPANGMGLVPADMSIGIDFNGKATVSNPVSKGQRHHIYEMEKILTETMNEVGGELLHTGDRFPFDLGGNHILGGARMSDDPAYGVTNPLGEVYGHKNLYVSDCSSIPAGLAINPAHTIGANALRVAKNIIESEGGRYEKN